MRVLDLFSGIGGFSLGLERAGGFETVAFSEIDQAACDILKKHWPEVPNLGDIRHAIFPDADTIVGGFPCQDLSRAGKRAGLSGARSGLFWELVRAIRLVRPRFVIMENVADLLIDGMGVVCGAMADSGYDTEWDCVPAYAVGSPQQRERIYIVANASTWDFSAWPSSSIRRGITGEDKGAAFGLNANANGTRQLQPGWCFTYLGGRPIHRGTGSDAWKSHWTDALSALCGMVDGVSRRLVETKGLGNAVVPQIPELIGRAIMAVVEQEGER